MVRRGFFVNKQVHIGITAVTLGRTYSFTTILGRAMNLESLLVSSDDCRKYKLACKA